MSKEETKKEAPSPNMRAPVREIGTYGIRYSNGYIYEESNVNFRWPHSIDTFKLMSYDPTIVSANNVIKSIIRKVKWSHKLTNSNPTPEQKEMVAFLDSCIDDMSVPFGDFVNETLSKLIYGFSVHEKVFKQRLGYKKNKKKSSKHNDGKMGWSHFPVRSQDTVYKWYFDDTGREIKYLVQDLSLVGYGNYSGITSNEIEIPYDRVLHFKHDSARNVPEGNSPLKGCYVAWKYKNTFEELEAITASRNMTGMPVIELPPACFSDLASDDERSMYEWAKTTIQNIHMSEEAGIVMPRDIDPDTRQNIYSFRLEGITGSITQQDLDKIISRYENKILMCYLADILKIGQDSSGSFALSESKNNLLSFGIAAILQEIADVLNHDLIPQTLIVNGFNIDQDIPKITYSDLDQRDLDGLSKFVQRLTSTGAIEKDEALSDWLRDQMGAPIVDREKLLDTENTSRSGDGFATAGNGTSDNNLDDDSSMNVENA